MSRNNLPPVLIIGYQRVDQVHEILEVIHKNGVSSVFVSVDAPREVTTQSLRLQNNLRELILSYEELFESLQIRILDSNLGCASHVLSAIDWAFDSVDELIILEDDCIPSNDFLNFSVDGLQLMKTNLDIALVCGTQHVPPEITHLRMYKSKYSLTWGWSTNKRNWLEIKRALSTSSHAKPLDIFSTSAEKIYWQEGARRAYEGYVDVWDTPLVNFLLNTNRFALLPGENLVTNVGNDFFATHMRGEEKWLFNQIGKYSRSASSIIGTNSEADRWLSKNFYRIRHRHLITTRLTRVKDYFFKPRFTKLPNYWANLS